MGLLLFLVLFLDVKLAIKVPVLAIVCICRPGLSIWNKVPVFYPLILVRLGDLFIEEKTDSIRICSCHRKVLQRLDVVIDHVGILIVDSLTCDR